MGELAGKQTAAAEAAKLKIENLLKNQPKDVVDAAAEAAVKAAQDEAKAQYLKEKGLDKGTGGTVISNLARGTAPGDAVNVDQLQNSGWNLDSKAVAGSSGKVISGNVSPSKVKMDETVNIDAGNNIEITRNGKNIEIATSMAPQFSSVSLGAGADAPTLSVDDEGALNVGSKKDNKPVRITNVAPGVKEGDVTNVAQLKGVAQNLNNRIDNVDGNARAGIAQAIATAGLVQAYLPGKSMMAIGGGTYRGEAGYAIGYSSISDGGNWIIKGTTSGNSRGHFGASASVGYQW
ncbi:TPA: YadA family autotransporter adhesin [Neisseria cinerea]